VYGPLHLYQFIVKSRYLPNDLKNIVDKTGRNNGYFAHSENILLAMLADTVKKTREKAVIHILKIREKHYNNHLVTTVRKFEVPEIQFNSEHYTEMIDWNKTIVTEPPLIIKLSNQDLMKFIDARMIEENIFKSPCHTQAVKRYVEAVSDAVKHTCDSSVQDGYIRSTVHSRDLMPKFDTKSDFKNKWLFFLKTREHLVHRFQLFIKNIPFLHCNLCCINC